MIIRSQSNNFSTVIGNHGEEGYGRVAAVLRLRLAEAPPTRIQLLVGPRQVGKTTLLLKLGGEFGARAVYASADAPEAALPAWADGIWRQSLDCARRGPAVLLLDEVQYLPDINRCRGPSISHSIQPTGPDPVPDQTIPMRCAAFAGSRLAGDSCSRSTRTAATSRPPIGGAFEFHESA
jgi:hypothetical protein